MAISLATHVIAGPCHCDTSRVTYWRHALPAYCHCDIVQSHLLEERASRRGYLPRSCCHCEERAFRDAAIFPAGLEIATSRFA